MKRRKIMTMLLAGLLSLTGCAGAAGGEGGAPAPEPEPEEVEEYYLHPFNLVQFQPVNPGGRIAVMETSKGTIRIRLFPEYAPKAVENFIGLSEEGFYDGSLFHRVIPNFMIQSGADGGTGATSIFRDAAGNPQPFEDEFSPDLRHFRGALSMANPGRPHSNLSQFFIVQNNSIGSDTAQQMRAAGFPEPVIEKYLEHGGTPHLDWGHSIFGFVIAGMDVVDAIAAVQTTGYPADRPLEDVFIISVTIEQAE